MTVPRVGCSMRAGSTRTPPPCDTRLRPPRHAAPTPSRPCRRHDPRRCSGRAAVVEQAIAVRRDRASAWRRSVARGGRTDYHCHAACSADRCRCAVHRALLPPTQRPSPRCTDARGRPRRGVRPRGVRARPPAVASISASAVAANASLTLSGSGFVGAGVPIVTVCGGAACPTLSSSTSITCACPPARRRGPATDRRRAPQGFATLDASAQLVRACSRLTVCASAASAALPRKAAPLAASRCDLWQRLGTSLRAWRSVSSPVAPSPPSWRRVCPLRALHCSAASSASLLPADPASHAGTVCQYASLSSMMPLHGGVRHGRRRVHAVGSFRAARRRLCALGARLDGGRDARLLDGERLDTTSEPPASRPGGVLDANATSAALCCVTSGTHSRSSST